jgi:C1A family cysteine protease
MKRTRMLVGLCFLALAAFNTVALIGRCDPAPVPVVQQPQKQDPPKVVVHGRGRVAPSPEKLKAMYAESNRLHGHKLRALPMATAATYDCRTLGIVPPIVDQGQCGSCWDFSGTGVCVSAFMKAMGTNAPGPLSEQYTLDCGQNGGCNGDDNTTVLAWAKTTGLPTTAAYGPYKGAAGSCKSGVALYKITDWGYAGSQQGVTATQDIKNAILAYGPVGCAIAAGGSAFWNTGQGTDTGTSTSIDHDVIFVGWDDSHDNGDGSKGAWIMRNSWSNTWGDKCANSVNPTPVEAGYGWVKYGADSGGTETVWAIVAGSPSPPAGAPVITSATSASGVVGQPFSYQIVASNSPISYSGTPLPGGLSCSTTGLISGVPTTAAVTQVSMSAVNASGTGTAILTLTVTAQPVPGGAPVIASPLTAAGVIGTPFSYQIVASNAPVGYAAVGLPAGLTIAPATGTITGTPTAAAVSSVTLFAFNAAGSGEATLTLTVTATPLNPVSVDLTDAQVAKVIADAGAMKVTRQTTIGEIAEKCDQNDRKAGVVRGTDGATANGATLDRIVTVLERLELRLSVLEKEVGTKTKEPPLPKK